MHGNQILGDSRREIIKATAGNLIKVIVSRREWELALLTSRRECMGIKYWWDSRREVMKAMARNQWS